MNSPPSGDDDIGRDSASVWKEQLDSPHENNHNLDGRPFGASNLLLRDYYPPSYTSGGGGEGGELYDNRRGVTGPPGPLRRNIPASVSSSDNNSDTTYAESGDINGCLRARMGTLDQSELV